MLAPQGGTALRADEVVSDGSGLSSTGIRAYLLGQLGRYLLTAF